MKTQLKFLTFAIATFNLAQASDATRKEVFDMIDSSVGDRSSARIPKIDDDQAQEAVRAFKNHCKTCDGCNDSEGQSNAVKIVGGEHRGYLKSQFDYLYNKTCDYLKVILDEEQKAREAKQAEAEKKAELAREAEREKIAIEQGERKAAEEERDRKAAEEERDRKAAEEERDRKVAEEELQEEELERANKEKADRTSCRRESCRSCCIS